MQRLLTSCRLQAQECSGASETCVLLGFFYLCWFLCICFFQAAAFFYLPELTSPLFQQNRQNKPASLRKHGTGVGWIWGEPHLHTEVEECFMVFTVHLFPQSWPKGKCGIWVCVYMYNRYWYLDTYTYLCVYVCFF